jgi:molybdate transport system substrate-binding protein
MLNLRRLTPLLLGVLVLAAGCARARKPAQSAASGDANTLTAYVACALVPVIESAAAKFTAANPGKRLKIESGEPAALVQKIEGGATPDLFICIGESEFGMLERDGLFDGSMRRSIGSLTLTLARPASSPPIAKPEDLASDSIKSIAIPLSGVTSLGTEAKHALERLGLWSKAQNKLALRRSGSEALSALAKGEASVGVIYDPCPLLKLPGKVDAKSIALGPSIGYPSERPASVQLGIHRSSPRTALAQEFIGFVRSSAMKADLAAAGIPVSAE